MARVTTLVYKATGRRSTTSGTVTPTPTTQTVRLPLVSNSQTFYSPSLEQDNLLLLPLVTNEQTFYGLVVSAAPVFVSPPLTTNTQTFFPPTVNQSIQLPLLTNEQTFYGSQVINGQAVVLPLVTNTQTFYGPQVNQTINVPLVSNAQTFYPLTVLQGTTIILPLVSNEQTFYPPQLNQKVSLPLVANTQTFYPPTVTTGQIVRLPFWANGQTFFPLKVNQKVICGFVNNTQTFFPPIVSANQLVVLPLVANSQTFYPPSVQQKITVPLVTNTSTVFSPAVVRDDTQLINVPLTTNTQTFFGPTLKLSVRLPRVNNVSGIFPPSVSNVATPGFALSTPVVTLTTAAGEIPEVDITMGADIYAGYYLRIQRSSDGVKNVSDGSYTTASVNIAHMVRAEEVDEDILAISSDNLIADGYVDPVSGVPWVQQYRWEREDGAISGWSNPISGTVTVATTVLYSVTNTVNVNSLATVSGTPPLVSTGRSGVGAPQTVRATAPMSGKKQREVTVTTLSDNYICIGHDDATTDYSVGFHAGGITNTKGFGLRINSTGFSIFKAGVAVQSGSTGVASGDVLSEVPDTNAGTCSYYRTRSGSTVQIGSTLTGISQPKYQAYQGVYSNSVLTSNYGQSTFARTLGVGESMYG